MIRVFDATIKNINQSCEILIVWYCLNDGRHIIYVNSEVKDETKLGKLMQDFYTNLH